MGVTPQPPRETESDHDLLTGQFIAEATRKAQSRAHHPDSFRINLTRHGSDFHDISAGQELSVMVFAEGIWITTTAQDDSR